MTLEVNYIAQVKDKKTGKIVVEQIVQSKSIRFPKSFKEFGLRHAEQIKLIKSSQDFFLTFQCQLFGNDDVCPQCGKKTRKQGQFQSDFHDVFTDHQVTIQRVSCHCGWQSDYTVKGMYGRAIHPELAKLQATTAANHSFEKACQIVNDFSCSERKINNRATFTRIISKVGEALNDYKKSEQWIQDAVAANELIVATDGGYVQNRELGKQSFEEMITTVFKPEDLITQKDGTRQLKQRLSVASAKQDGQQSIKKLTQNACKKLGMNKNTQVTALTDGATNCWSIINALSPHCDRVIKILDWFHIGKKFQERTSYIPGDLKVYYDKAKWHCWHGRPGTALVRLRQVIEQLSNQEAIKKLRELMKYILNNQAYIVNYHSRRLKKLSYSSQLAETSVNSIINERQKHKKMQWSRKGAHNLLQIRTSLFSRSWESDWKVVETALYKQAA